MSAKVGVVGGGLGGLAAAAVLAARGAEVVLFERNEWLGGKAAELRLDGFRFDMGPTIMMLPSAWRRVFEAAGRRLEDEVELLGEALEAVRAGFRTCDEEVAVRAVAIDRNVELEQTIDGDESV